MLRDRTTEKQAPSSGSCKVSGKKKKKKTLILLESGSHRHSNGIKDNILMTTFINPGSCDHIYSALTF
jgi:hypothetical protein